MRHARRTIHVALLLACLVPAARAGTVATESGVQFTHHDWQLVCDNTRTCRTAGYQRDDDEQAVSVLFTRKAGAGTPVSGELMLGTYGDIVLPASVILRIDDRNVGELAIDGDEGTATLSTAHVQALLDVLPHSATITFDSTDDRRWTLSDRGATAVLLKMDEAQGRLDTAGALVRRGTRDDAGVLPPLPVPVVHAAPVAAARAADARLADDPALREALIAALDGVDACGERETMETDPLTVDRLDDDTLLASLLCWRGAYQESRSFWLIDAAAPYRPRLVTPAASEYADGEIVGSMKGRGLGDCWWHERRVWTGDGFARAGESSTGLCRLVAIGGAWDLPIFVSDVQR